MTEKTPKSMSADLSQDNRIRRIPSPLLPHRNSGGHQPSTRQRYWLTRPGALTEVLCQLGHFSLEVVYEGSLEACAEDARLLGCAVDASLWSRDVMLRVDGCPLVHAHSIAPLNATEQKGGWKALRIQGQQPLATLLYHDPRIKRSAFTWQSVQYPLALHGTRPTDENGAPLWARHSCFMRDNQPLVITETFLNAFWCHPHLAQLR